ncbi:MAG: hypothetical protein ACJ8JD_09565 [Chthoniobacterales bacterium]
MAVTTNDSSHTVSSGIYKLARVLGYLSIVIGLTELIWADSLALSLGLSRFEWLVRAYGVREILTGVLILVSKDPTPWIWLRVLGDMLDGATLGWGYSRDPYKLMSIAMTFATVTPVIIADIYCALKLTKGKRTT